MKELLQLVERETYSYLPIYCSFCGQSVYKEDNISTELCQHVLFIATDDGFMHLATRARVQLEKQGYQFTEDENSITMTMTMIMTMTMTNEVKNTLYDTFDSLTDKLHFTDGVKIACYMGAPGFYGFYIGFAPTDEE